MATSGAIGGLLTSSVGSLTMEEEQLAKAMNEIGPFTAIGKPEGERPELGGAHLI